jgi:hypothetical protein
MRQHARLEFCSLALSLAFSFSSRARAQTPQQAVVWYRASEQCPAGPAFLARLADQGARTRLAEPADHFDFLVTLVASKGETIGRLERQTQSGTVAIRELRDASCERVADGLALGLSLALEPGAAAKMEPEPEPPSAIAPAAPHEPELQPATQPTPRDAGPKPPLRANAATRRNRWSVGVLASALEGAMPRPLWQGLGFVDFTRASAAGRPSFGLRLGFIGSLGSVDTQVGSVNHWIAAGRAEVCPWRLGSTQVGLWPCATFELGAAGASDARPSGLNARDVWAAPGGALRLAYEVVAPISLEAQAGALVPLRQETVYAGATALYSAEIIAFQAAVGVSARVW